MKQPQDDEDDDEDELDFASPFRLITPQDLI